MSRQRLKSILLAFAGLLLITNSLWLVPNEGAVLHTYERSEVIAEDGTLAYHGQDVLRFGDENDLTPIDCVDFETNHIRSCALDYHLLNHSPITVPSSVAGETDAEFVRIEDGYYRRIVQHNDSTDPPSITLDVEPVSPQTILRESAVDISDIQEVDPDHGVRLRVLLTGETETSFTRLSDHDLGSIYERNGSYYVVVKTGERVIDHGPLLHGLQYDGPRYVLATFGVVLLIGAYLHNRDGGKG